MSEAPKTPDVEEHDQSEAAPPAPDQAPTNGGAGGFTPITTQEEYNKLTARVRKTAVAKYADFDTYKASHERLSELEQLAATETERANAAEARVTELEAAAELEAWKREAAAESGIPDPSVLAGSTQEEIQAHAKKISALYSGPYSQGEGRGGGKPAEVDKTAYVKEKMGLK